MSVAGNSSSSLQVKTMERLGPVSATWDHLADSQPLPSPFMKSWWIDNIASGSLAILCFFDGTELVGGAAFELDAVRVGPLKVERVRCVGQGVLAPDHLDILAADSHRSAVVDATLKWLRRPGSRIVDLDGLASRGGLAGALDSHVVDRIPAPFASLPSEGPTYLADRPGTLRSTVKRGRNRFAKAGVSFSRTPPSDVERSLDSLAELHDGRWSEESEFLHAFDRFRVAAAAGAKSGDVLIHELSSETTGVVAVELDLLAGQRICFYQAGRRTEREWRGCGTVLRADLIDLICQEDRTEYDMLRGDEPYKSDWATSERSLLRCRFGVGPLGKALIVGANAWKRSQPTLHRLRSYVRRTVSRVPWSPRRESRIEM
ncbi:MAG TPA: GNAT family N-acetyltransferase [Microthrixaceae bacterium]|nr:GNAT family N-acetyltransferase [Microthrixaceae bacterium]